MLRRRLLGASSLSKNSWGHPYSPINRLLAGSSILESEQRHSIPIRLVPEFLLFAGGEKIRCSDCITMVAKKC